MSQIAHFHLIDDFGNEFVSPYIIAEYDPKWRHYWTAEDYRVHDKSGQLPCDWYDMRNSPQCWFARTWMLLSVRDANNHPARCAQ